MSCPSTRLAPTQASAASRALAAPPEMMAPLQLQPHTDWYQLIGPELTSFGIMYRKCRFYVSLSLEDLENSDFEETYIELVETIQRDEEDAEDALASLCRLMVTPCLDLIAAMARKQTATSGLPTMEQFYFAPTTYARLRVDATGSRLCAQKTPKPEHIRIDPALIPSDDLPAKLSVPRVPASRVRLVEFADEIRAEVPRVVTVDGFDKPRKAFFFKAFLQQSRSLHEIRQHMRLLAAGLPAKVRVPHLRGIVMSDDTQYALGLLFDLIDQADGQTLVSEESVRQRGQHAAWERDVHAVVAALHAHGIVWGDAQPANVVVDRAGHCWVVDFRGRRPLGRYVDADRAGTPAGDRQGVERMFQWLDEQARGGAVSPLHEEVEKVVVVVEG